MRGIERAERRDGPGREPAQHVFIDGSEAAPKIGRPFGAAPETGAPCERPAKSRQNAFCVCALLTQAPARRRRGNSTTLVEPRPSTSRRGVASASRQCHLGEQVRPRTSAPDGLQHPPASSRTAGQALMPPKTCIISRRRTLRGETAALGRQHDQTRRRRAVHRLHSAGNRPTCRTTDRRPIYSSPAAKKARPIRPAPAPISRRRGRVTPPAATMTARNRLRGSVRQGRRRSKLCAPTYIDIRWLALR